MKKEEKQLIDRFLENNLTGFELKNFHDRLEYDPDFRKKVSFHNLLIDGIRESENIRLSGLIRQHIAYKKPAIPLGLKLIVTFFIIMACGIALWNYLEPESSGERNKYFSLDFLKHNKNIQSVNNNEEAKSNKETKPIMKQQDPALASSDSLADLDQREDADTVSNQQNEEEIIVKKDQMLISLSLKPIKIEADSLSKDLQNGSAGQTVSEALNPAADLPADYVSESDAYVVEFWVSPVNYTGYKLADNKLILFGIEEPDAVKLFSKNDKLWMKYGHAFYSLRRNDQFESLSVSSEIPTQKR